MNEDKFGWNKGDVKVKLVPGVLKLPDTPENKPDDKRPKK